MDDPSLGAPLYSLDPSEVRSLITIGSSGLAVILRWEEEALPTAAFGQGSSANDEDDERPAWTFLTLAMYDSAQRGNLWFTSLEEALLAVAQKQADRNSKASPALTIPTPKLPPKSREEMAEGEGTTPGAYGAAEDFWEGWEDDEPHGGDEAVATGAVGAGRDQVDDNYWDSYGGMESEVGGDDSEGVNGGHYDGPDAESIPPPPISHDGHSDTSSSHYSSPDPATVPKPVVRSRRSSTIRAPISGLGSTSPNLSRRGSSDPAKSLPSPPLNSTRLFQPLPPAPSHLTSLSSPPLASQASFPSLHESEASYKTSRETFEDPEDEALRFALAGVWGLFSKGRVGDQDRRDRFLRVAAQVTRS